MNAEDFTEPFALDRWIAGETAYSLLTGNFLIYDHKDEKFAYTKDKSACAALSSGDRSAWRMKPKASDDGWIPVVDGKCAKSFAIGDILDVRYLSGSVFEGALYMGGLADHIVAVRLVKPKAKPATQCKFCDTAIENEEGIVGEVCCDVCNENYEYISPMGRNELPVLFTKEEQQETEKQRLTREASTAYFAKHFAKQAPYIPMRDGEMEEIAAAALRAFEAELTRKRGE